MLSALSRLTSMHPYWMAAALGAVSRLPSINNSILFIDEPLYLAQARLLNSFGAFVFASQYRV
ncbi:MAG: hypothetical protein M3014_05370, partial [Chloroflexota bacterium]|nr:hypothetical protein [Chloroflexota bacterium]